MRSRIIIASLAVAALAGCADAPQAQPPSVQQVLVPTPVPCKITPPAKPAFAVDALPLGAGIWDQTAALRAERKQRQGYESELEAAVQACG